jgi:hypothetical protein
VPRPVGPRLHISPALRAWLDNRPFWAGLCLIGAGIQIGFWPALGESQRSGVSEIMFLVLLVSDGLAVWSVPLYRRLLGVQAAALGILAVTTENLGGLLIGTCAAILGGAMAFRWQPAASGRPPRPVERVLKAVPPVREAEPDKATDAPDPVPAAELEREVERTAELEVEPTAELEPAPERERPSGPKDRMPETESAPERKPAPKLALVAAAGVPAERGPGRHEAPRPRPAASAAEDELLATAERDEQSFIPGF